MTWHKSFGESARQIAKQVPFITENLNLPFRDKDWLPPLNLSRSESSPCRNNPIFWGHEAVNVQSPCRGSRSGSKKIQLVIQRLYFIREIGLRVVQALEIDCFAPAEEEAYDWTRQFRILDVDPKFRPIDAWNDHCHDVLLVHLKSNKNNFENAFRKLQMF